MTYPNQPQYPPAPPQAPPPQYPQQGYPPQQQYPAYPPQPQYPQQGYPPAPAAPPEKATLGDFWDQPAGGSKPLQWNTPGTTYTFVVSRPITDADTEVQRDKQNQVKRFRDGTPMKVLKIPCLMSPTAEYPDGTADFYVKGNDTAELKRALGEAGMNPGKPPPMGTVITVQYTHDRPVPGGFNPAKVKRITIQRPQGMPPFQEQQGNGQQANPTAGSATTMTTAAPAAGSQYPTAPSPALPVMPPSQPAPPVGQQPVPQPQGQVQPPPPAPAPQAAQPAQAPAQAPLAAPPGMSPENAALLAQLTGQAPPQ